MILVESQTQRHSGSGLGSLGNPGIFTVTVRANTATQNVNNSIKTLSFDAPSEDDALRQGLLFLSQYPGDFGTGADWANGPEITSYEARPGSSINATGKLAFLLRGATTVQFADPSGSWTMPLGGGAVTPFVPAAPVQTTQRFRILLHYYLVFSSGETFFGGNVFDVDARSVGEAYLLARDYALTTYPPARYGYHKLGMNTDGRETWIAWQSASVPGGLTFFPLPSGPEYALPSGTSDIPSASVVATAAQTHAELFPDLYRTPTVTGTDKEAIEIINSGATAISFFSFHNDADYIFRALKFKAPSNPLVIYDEAGIQAASAAWPDTMYLVNSQTLAILKDHGPVSSPQDMVTVAINEFKADGTAFAGQVAEKDLMYMKALVLDRLTHPSVWLYIGQLVVPGTPGAYVAYKDRLGQNVPLRAGGNDDPGVVWKDPFDPVALSLWSLNARYHPTSILNGLHIYAHVGVLGEIQRRYAEKAQQEAGAWTTRRIIEFVTPAVIVAVVAIASGQLYIASQPGLISSTVTIAGVTISTSTLITGLVALAIVGMTFLPMDPNDLQMALRVGAVIAIAFVAIKEVAAIIAERLSQQAALEAAQKAVQEAALKAAQEAAQRAVTPAPAPPSPPTVPLPVSVPTPPVVVSVPGRPKPMPAQASVAIGPVLLVAAVVAVAAWLVMDRDRT